METNCVMNLFSFFKPTDLALHEILDVIDTYKGLQKEGDTTVDDVYWLARQETGLTDKRFQRLYDKLLSLKLFEITDGNKIYLTKSGETTLLSSRFHDKYRGNLYRRSVTILLLSCNIILAIVALIQTSDNGAKKANETLHNIEQQLKEISASIKTQPSQPLKFDEPFYVRFDSLISVVRRLNESQRP